jgi:hypothetical protein
MSSFFNQASASVSREEELIREAGYPIEPAGMFDPRSDIENDLLRLASELMAALGRVKLVAKGHKLVDGSGDPVLDGQGKRLDEDMDQLASLAEAAKDRLESAAVAAAKSLRDEQDAKAAE